MREDVKRWIAHAERQRDADLARAQPPPVIRALVPRAVETYDDWSLADEHNALRARGVTWAMIADEWERRYRATAKRERLYRG